MSQGMYLACTKCRKAVHYFDFNNDGSGYNVGRIDFEDLINFSKIHKSHEEYISLKLITEQDYLDNYGD